VFFFIKAPILFIVKFHIFALINEVFHLALTSLMIGWVDTQSDARDTCYWKQHIT